MTYWWHGNFELALGVVFRVITLKLWTYLRWHIGHLAKFLVWPCIKEIWCSVLPWNLPKVWKSAQKFWFFCFSKESFLSFPLELTQKQLEFWNQHWILDPNKWHHVFAMTSSSVVRLGSKNVKNHPKNQTLNKGLPFPQKLFQDFYS